MVQSTYVIIRCLVDTTIIITVTVQYCRNCHTPDRSKPLTRNNAGTFDRLTQRGRFASKLVIMSKNLSRFIASALLQLWCWPFLSMSNKFSGIRVMFSRQKCTCSWKASATYIQHYIKSDFRFESKLIFGAYFRMRLFFFFCRLTHSTICAIIYFFSSPLNNFGASRGRKQWFFAKRYQSLPREEKEPCEISKKNGGAFNWLFHLK